MKTLLKRMSLVAVAAAAIMTVSSATRAQDYPNRPVHLITNAGPGTPADLILRVLGEELRKTMNQQFVVESKLGGGGVIAYEYTLSQPADGYTYLLGNLPVMALFPLTVKDLRFDPVKDFTPVVGVAELNLAWATQPNMPWKNFNEMIAAIKAQPDKMFYADTSVFTRVWTEGFLGHYGLKVTRVPYKNQADAYRDLMTGTINVQFAPLGTLLGLGDDKAKPMIWAVTSPQRDPVTPNIPTITEMGAPELAVGGNFTMVARTGTPKPAIDAMAVAITKALKTPEVATALVKGGAPVLIRSPEEAQKVQLQLVQLFTSIAKRIDLQPE